LEVLFDDLLHGLPEHMMRNAQKLTALERLNRGGPGRRIHQSKFPKAVPRSKFLNILLLVVQLNGHNSTLNNKEHCGGLSLLENVLICVGGVDL
jgi:hypothetical protein